MVHNQIRKILLLPLAFGTSAIMAAPVVSDVVYRQDADTKIVKVTYMLSGDSGVPLLDIRTNGVSVGWSNLRGAYGDVHKLVHAGSVRKTIYWNPVKHCPGLSLASGVTAVVRVWPKDNPPDIMVVNCEKQYAGRDDAVEYFVSEDQLPEGTLNSPVYKTHKIAFRKIPAAGIVWRMGSPSSEKGHNEYEVQRKVRLTSNYYLGVFEVTQAQYKRFTGENPSNFKTDGAMRPVENISWNNIRGTGAVWPGESSSIAYDSVVPTSFLGKLRAHAGNGLKFDLPTEAQWEFACRAGSGAAFPDGTSLVTGSESSWPFMETHARYINNSAEDAVDSNNTLSTNVATAAVGTYLPSRWGLYDMHGNLFEWTLDHYAEYETAEGVLDDPCGAATDSSNTNKRTTRGGSYLLKPTYSRCARRYEGSQPQGSRHFGFRICLPLDH
jgi:formylglycine-generating enzyme required for sulfatase activity